MKLSIIIVHYKTPELTAQCLHHIFKSDFDLKNLEIIVVDNHSQDNAGFGLTRDYPEINWIESPDNVGFGRANNLGIALATGEFVLLINSDVFLDSDTIHLCLEKFDQSTGALGCLLLNEDGSIQNSKWYHVADFKELWMNNLLLDKIHTLKRREIKAIMGAFMLMSRDVLNRARAFDPDFFMYAEEQDLCLRIRDLGYEIKYFPEAKAIHKHRGSPSKSNWREAQRHLSIALLYYKHRGLLGYVSYLLLAILSNITNVFLSFFVSGAKPGTYIAILRSHFSNLLVYFVIPFRYDRSFDSGRPSLKK